MHTAAAGEGCTESLKKRPLATVVSFGDITVKKETDHSLDQIADCRVFPSFYLRVMDWKSPFCLS